MTGLKDGKLSDQLANFATSYTKAFYPGLELLPPKSWREAFTRLSEEIARVPKNKKVIIFLDELPWLATKRSAFIQNLDHFWNTVWSRQPNIKLITCGSAASWMLDNLINAKGGLYNRLTHTLHLQPYDLAQTKQFLSTRGIKWNNKQILDIYFVTGGIPHYLKQINKSRSAIQNIDDICFKTDGLLFDEFGRLFKSLFDNPELSEDIIRAISKSRYGISIAEITKKVGVQSGGTFRKKLDELEAAGFIKQYLPMGRTKRDQYYRVIDEYSYFYLNWIEKYKQQGLINPKQNYWHMASQASNWKAWSGYAFESVCYKHINKIHHKLGLDSILCHFANWKYSPKKGSDERGSQIDLVIDRNDGVITICEMRYSSNEIQIDKNSATNLLNKMETFEKETKTNKKINFALVTTQGLKDNAWSDEIIDNLVTLDDFFE